jgi:hypothetical protein
MPRSSGSPYSQRGAIVDRTIETEAPSCLSSLAHMGCVGLALTLVRGLPHHVQLSGIQDSSSVLFSFLKEEIRIYTCLLAKIAGYAGAYPAYPIGPPLVQPSPRQG